MPSPDVEKVTELLAALAVPKNDAPSAPIRPQENLVPLVSGKAAPPPAGFKVAFKPKASLAPSVPTAVPGGADSSPAEEKPRLPSKREAATSLANFVRDSGILTLKMLVPASATESNSTDNGSSSTIPSDTSGDPFVYVPSTVHERHPEVNYGQPFVDEYDISFAGGHCDSSQSSFDSFGSSVPQEPQQPLKPLEGKKRFQNRVQLFDLGKPKGHGLGAPGKPPGDFLRHGNGYPAPSLSGRRNNSSGQFGSDGFHSSVQPQQQQPALGNAGQRASAHDPIARPSAPSSPAVPLFPSAKGHHPVADSCTHAHSSPAHPPPPHHAPPPPPPPPPLPPAAAAASHGLSLTSNSNASFVPTAPSSLPPPPCDVGLEIGSNGAAPELQSVPILERLAAMADDNTNADSREGALMTYAAICTVGGPAVEPYIVPQMPLFLERLSDKIPAVRAAAESAALAAARLLREGSVPRVMPALISAGTPSRRWQTKEGAFKVLIILTETCPEEIRDLLPEVVPLVSDGITDARDEVKRVAWEAAENSFLLAGNRDIAACTSSFLTCIQKPKEVPDSIVQLSGTTFVQSVEAPALAVMVPLLIKGLREETAIKRKTAVIIANMSKLVTNPLDACLFLPKLLPRLEQAAKETADPECRGVCAMAMATVKRVADEGASMAEDPEIRKPMTEAQISTLLAKAVAPHLVVVEPPLTATDPFIRTALNFAAGVLARSAIRVGVNAEEACDKAIAPYLSGFLEDPVEGPKATAKAYAELYNAANKPKVTEEEDDADGIPPLCDCEFSLAYGGKILLNNARLRLKRGRRYGLCGHNGVGKSTLMKAINAGKVDGFPPKSEICTVYLESDVDPSLAELPCVEFVFQDPTLKEKPVPPTEEEVVNTLESVGFDSEKRLMAVGRLSGGWRMKLALARAMLMRPDILLLDEPTNHLDVGNVAWLENYLSKEIPHVTCLIVSHDSGFLDTVCTDIAHYETRKLRYYRGNLSEFVKVKPEAKSYYTLQSATLHFTFPKPTFLDGVTSSEKPLLSLKKVTFTYPGVAKPQLTDVTCACRLGSRVAVLGPNGAGKSTVIKLLTGEIKPDKGTLVRHPNVRVAYVSQHALHHLEDHLDKTPNQYLRKRYAAGEDREESEKVTRKLSDEEQDALLKQVWMIEGQRRVFYKLLGRRKKKKTFEYEVQWAGLSSIEYNRWITREELLERGFDKVVNEMDGRVNAEKGEAAARPLTVISVEQYLQDFGLEPEFGTHSAIRGLSGGQKVKLVLAAAMWHCPHLLILDEPTNYLDRDSLGALASAIRAFEGGVVMISHHNEFVGVLSNEVWDLKDGKLTCHAKTKDPVSGK